jgi:hypothetical protein
MTQLEKAQCTNKPCEFVPFARLFVLFFAAMISVTSTANVFAQQSAQIDPQIDPQSRNASTKTDVNQKETNNLNQLSTAAATKTAAYAIRPFHVNFPKVRRGRALFDGLWQAKQGGLRR